MGQHSDGLVKPRAGGWGRKPQRPSVIPVWPVGGSIVQQQRAQALEEDQAWLSVLVLSLANHPLLPCAMLHSAHSFVLHSLTYQVPVVLPPKCFSYPLLFNLIATFMWSPSLQIFLLPYSLPLFTLWDSNYTFIRLFDIIPQLWEAWFYFLHPTAPFSFCFSLGDFFCSFSNSLVLPPLAVSSCWKAFWRNSSLI